VSIDKPYVDSEKSRHLINQSQFSGLCHSHSEHFASCSCQKKVDLLSVKLKSNDNIETAATLHHPITDLLLAPIKAAASTAFG
jgi:hypothetical protein